jgi:hypothetical protein
LTIKLTEADVQNCSWTVTGQDEFYRYSVGRGTHPVTGVPIEVLKKEFLADAELVSLNTEERNARDSKSWSAGMGSEKGGNVPMIRVGRIPLAKMFSELAPKMREGDKDHLRWWLERDENQPFRTKSGSLK